MSKDAGDRGGTSGDERLTAPPDDSRRSRLPFPVVGVGAGAGGLEAYTQLLQACPADSGMAFVLIQHFPPDRESLLAEILSRQTAMPVLEVSDGLEVEPDHVYVIRPGHTLTIQDGRLHLGTVLAARGHGRPVDDFFRSLAEEQQQRAIAVVFSGMGSNGTAGAQAVKAVDKRCRIFRRVGPTRPGTLDLHTPAAVAVDSAGLIVHVHGDTSRFLTLPAGQPTLDLMAMANDQVRETVRTALHRAAESRMPVTVRDGTIETPEGRQRVEVEATPIGPRGASPLYLVTFRVHPEPAPPPLSPDAEGAAEGQLSEELRRTRDELQCALEEMQSLNEELVKEGRLVTFLGVNYPGAHDFSPEEVELVREVADRSWAAVERARAEAMLAAELDAMTRLRDLSDRLLSTTDLDDAMGEVLDTAVALHAADRGTVQVYDPAIDGLRYVATVGFDAASLAAVPPVDRDFHSTCAAALRTGEPVLVPDLAADPRFAAHRPTSEALGYRAAFSFPLTTRRGEFLGVLTVHFRGRREPSERELRWAALYAPMAAHLIERQQAGTALRSSGERLRLALTAARMGIWTLDVETGMQMRDANLNRLLGLEPRETSQPFEEFLAHIHPDDAPAVRGAFDVASREARPLHVEFRIVRPDGSVRWLRDQGDVFGDAASGARNMAGACVDVTDLKETEGALRLSEERLRAVATNLPNAAVFVVTPDLRYRMADGHALRMAGFLPSDLEGRLVAEVMNPELVAMSVPNYRRALAGESIAVEHAAHGRHFITHLAPLRDPGGQTVAALAVSYDITDRVLAEEEVRRANDDLEARVAERTAELEAEAAHRRDLARRLSSAQEDERQRVSRDLHDTVGQLMTGLSLSLKALERSSELEGPAAAALADVQAIMESLGQEVHGLAVRLRPTSLDDFGLEAAIRQLVEEWSGRSGVRAGFTSADLGPTRLPREVETAVYRVVQEALTNVAKHAGASQVAVVLSRLDGELTAVVEDDGIGFDPEAAPATRLGLVGMRERAALVGGELDIESRPGSGTTVFVRIPIRQGGD